MAKFGPAVQRRCALFVAKKHMPDGLGHRAFFLVGTGAKKVCSQGKLRVFYEAGALSSPFRMHVLRELAGGWDATSPAQQWPHS